MISLSDYPKEKYRAYFSKNNAVDNEATQRLGSRRFTRHEVDIAASLKLAGHADPNVLRREDLVMREVVVESPRYSGVDLVARIYCRRTNAVLEEKEFRAKDSENHQDLQEKADVWIAEKMKQFKLPELV
jgi:hypothetical protein